MSKSADDFLARRPELLDRDFTWRPALRFMSAVGALLGVYFRVRGEGLERVPPGGCLLVANHSSGAVFETILLLRWWRSAMGDRVAHGLMHRIAFEFPLRILPFGPWMGRRASRPPTSPYRSKPTFCLEPVRPPGGSSGRPYFFWGSASALP